MDETEKGWFIQYIDRDPKLLAKQAAMDQKMSADLTEEDRIQKSINAQIAATKDAIMDREVSTATELQKDGPGMVSLSLGESLASKKRIVLFEDNEGESNLPPNKKANVAALFSLEEVESNMPSRSVQMAAGGALAALREEEERRKSSILKQEDAKNRKDYWLHPGILVKVMNKSLSDGRFYKQKGSVLRVLDDYVGEVYMNDSGTTLRLDQADLETVVPKVGVFTVFFLFIHMI